MEARLQRAADSRYLHNGLITEASLAQQLLSCFRRESKKWESSLECFAILTAALPKDALSAPVASKQPIPLHHPPP